MDKILEYRQDMGRIGGRKLLSILQKELPEDLQIGRDALFELLDRNGLKVHRKIRRVRTTYSNHWMRKYPNLIKGFVPTHANMIWVSDITYIKTEDGFVYLHLITDLYSHKIVGWCVSPDLSAHYTVQALTMAIRGAQCDLKGLIHHSDRGSQYCCAEYVKVLQDKKIEISMTENGDPLENAVAERVNGILKMEWLHREVLRDLEHARYRVSEIVNIYNGKRPHLSIDYFTPNEAHVMNGEIKKRWKNYYKQSDSGGTGMAGI